MLEMKKQMNTFNKNCKEYYLKRIFLYHYLSRVFFVCIFIVSGLMYLDMYSIFLIPIVVGLSFYFNSKELYIIHKYAVKFNKISKIGKIISGN